MKTSAPIPRNDPRRLAALRSLDASDRAQDDDFDALAGTAAALCGTPIAHVVLVDEIRQWFMGSVGMPDMRQLTGECMFSNELVATGKALTVEDASLDPRFADHPFVTGPHDMQFYAGEPIRFGRGVTLGSVCVIDHVPRLLTRHQRLALRGLAGVASRTLASRAAALRADATYPADDASPLQASPDDLPPTTRGADQRVTAMPFALPNPNRLDLHDLPDVLLWADDLSITADQLTEIAGKVGPMRAAIRGYVATQRRATRQPDTGT